MKQIYVYGDSYNSYLVAVGVPDKDQVKSWAKSNDVDNMEELLESEDLKSAVIEDLDQIAKENKFNGLERIKKIFLSEEEFTQENELLTVTMKVKRNVAQKKFKDQIQEMYKNEGKQK